MNILLVHNYYKIRGGEDSVFENESAELEKRGHKVIKYTRKNSEIDKYNFIQKILFFPRSIYNFKTVGDLKKILKNETIDIAHIHNVFPIISPSIYRYLKKKGIKTVQTIHNYRFLCPNGLFFRDGSVCELCSNGNYFNAVKYKCYKNSTIFSLLYAFIIKLNYNVFRENIDGYIALTEFTKRKLVDSGFNENKIYIKANGMIDKRPTVSETKNYFLYIGRLSKEKGIDFLLESFSKITNMKLIIAGDYSKSPEYYEKYKGCPNIKFFGFADEAQKETLINESLAVIVPSVCYDNYPIALVEAFRAGITAVGSAIGGIPYIISDGVNGELFEPNNFEQFKSKIEKLYNDCNYRKKLNENARATFLEKMEFSKNITILEEIYKFLNNP